MQHDACRQPIFHESQRQGFILPVHAMHSSAVNNLALLHEA